MERIRQFSQYLKEVRIETRKVTFPDRKSTMATTSVVIVVVLVIGFYLGIVDFVLSRLLGLALD